MPRSASCKNSVRLRARADLGGSCRAVGSRRCSTGSSSRLRRMGISTSSRRESRRPSSTKWRSKLSHEPGIETRNRKRMQPGKPGFIAPWELRVEDMRVYYEVSEDPGFVVTVRAIGVKAGNRVRIGGEWWEPAKEADR